MLPIPTKTVMSSLKATSSLSLKNGRLLETIHETSNLFGAKGRWGNGPNETGVCRLALSDEDKQVRDWFIKEVKLLGCTVKIDDMGSIFAIYPGKNEGKPTAIGSHLDTQPTGGRYDGILGVLCGLEVLRTLKDNKYVPNYPIAVINWTNEEGARFPVTMNASSVYAKMLSKETAYSIPSITDSKPVTFLDELERIGYKGNVPSDYDANPIAAHFELHIEQGPILEQKNKRIGLVQGIQALKWIEIVIDGKAQHTGTTPINARSDPLLAASHLVVKANELAHKFGGLITIAAMDIMPSVANVIPEKVKMVVDVRHHLDENFFQMEQELFKELDGIIKSVGLKFAYKSKDLLNHSAVHFDETCKKCFKDASDELFGEEQSMQLVSGALHDSGPVSKVCPTAMIFIPSKDGVSHNFEEYSSPEQVSDGFQVMLNAVLKYDKLRVE